MAAMRTAASLAQRLAQAAGSLGPCAGAPQQGVALAAAAVATRLPCRWMSSATSGGDEPPTQQEGPSHAADAMAASASEGAATPLAAAATPAPSRRRRQPLPLDGIATVTHALQPREHWHSTLPVADLLTADDCTLATYFDVQEGLTPEAAAQFYHDPLLADERGLHQVDYGCKGMQAEFACTNAKALMHRPVLKTLLADVAAGTSPRIYLDGWTGAGKSVALYALVQWARAAGWVVMYVPSATLLIQGGRFYRSEEEEEPVWDTPEAARHIISALMQAHGDQLQGLTAADGSGASLAEIAAEGLAAGAPRAVVEAAMKLKEGLLAAGGEGGPRTLVVVDDYNSLYWKTTYQEPIHAFYSRPIPPGELRLAAAFRLLEQTPAPGGNGVAVVAPTFGASISPALRLPRGGAPTLRVPRYNLNEVAAVAQQLADSKVLPQMPSPDVLRRALALTNGNAKELREAAMTLLHEDDPLGLSLGYKAAAAARTVYNRAVA